MTHVVHPYSARLGIIRPWKSRWFNSRGYSKTLKEDVVLREFLEKRLRGMFVDAVEIERSPDSLTLIIKTTRPGMIIGRGGEGVDRLKKEVLNLVNKERKGSNEKLPQFKLNIEEVKFPESHSNVMVGQIAQDLEKRLPFRRVMKQNLSKIAASRQVKGVKIALSGRLDGSEMARHEWLKDGRIPLQTLRADIDFARGRAHLPYGDVGIKVWIYRGEIFEDQPKPEE